MIVLLVLCSITSVHYNRNSNDPPDADPLTHLRPSVFYKGKEPLQIEFEVLDHLQVRNSSIYISVGALNTGLDQTLQVMLPFATTQMNLYKVHYLISCTISTGKHPNNCFETITMSRRVYPI